jgi:hypothetical protein
MKSFAKLSMTICILMMGLTGASHASDKPEIVNLIVDLDSPVADINNLLNIYNAAVEKNLSWTLSLTENAALDSRLFLAQLGRFDQIELGMSGNYSDEKLSTKSYEEQKAILTRSEERVKKCNICGINEITVRGFKPQSYDQNKDTYKVLDELGIGYDAGFKAGILYAPGHENDVWPYKVENHNFYAVPVSTYTLSGEKVALDDQEIKDKGLSSSQWYDLLVGKFDEASGKDEPMVISLSTSVSGTGDYLDALKQFLNYAASNNAKFVKTSDLVNMSITGVHEAPDSSAMNIAPFAENHSQATGSGCAECDAAKNTTINAVDQNKTIFM